MSPEAANGARGEARTGTFARGKMRRRLRRQQQVREALLLDLGALVFELHRQGRREPELLQAKAAELSTVDEEVRALSDLLGTDQASLRLVAPGIVGSCEKCGTLMTTDASFCSNCGAPAAPVLSGDHLPPDELDGKPGPELRDPVPTVDAEGETTGIAARTASGVRPEPQQARGGLAGRVRSLFGGRRGRS